jgi:hypothetical protein
MGSFQVLYFRQNENLFSSIPMKVPLFKSQTFVKENRMRKPQIKSLLKKQQELFQFVRDQEALKNGIWQNQSYKI